MLKRGSSFCFVCNTCVFLSLFQQNFLFLTWVYFCTSCSLSEFITKDVIRIKNVWSESNWIRGREAKNITTTFEVFYVCVFIQLFSLVIFGCVSNEGYINRPDEVKEFCIFNRNQNACNYAVGMGSLAFLSCMLFLALDVYFPQISSVKDRKKAVLADVGTSGRRDFLHILRVSLESFTNDLTCLPSLCFSVLVLHVVRWFLFSGKSVAGV